MHMSDSREIKAAPSVVWAALLDAGVLKECIPGCTEVTGTRTEGYQAVVTQKVGPVKATFKGAVTLSDIIEGGAVKLSGEGKGGPAGFAKGGAVVRLEPTPDGTRLTWEVEANVGGKLAQLGSRVIDGFARKMADAFFSRFQTAVERPTEPEATAAPDQNSKETATDDLAPRPGR